MSLSRRRKKELKKLRSNAEELWLEQQNVLSRAGSVAREASRQGSLYTQEHVIPRVVHSYEANLKPGVDLGYKAGRDFAHTAKDKITGDVVPALAAVVGSAASVLELSKVGKVAGSAAEYAKKKVGKTVVPPKKSGPGAGGWVLISFGIVALAGIAYAAWQTFRADDDLWVADDEPAAPESNPTA